MQHDPSEKIKECLSRAAALRKQAVAATDSASKSDLRGLELQWLDIAESYKLVEQSNSFLKGVRTRRLAASERLASARRRAGQTDAAMKSARRWLTRRLLTCLEFLSVQPSNIRMVTPGGVLLGR